MEEKTFSALMDRTRQDRLEGEILLFCSDLEEHGYNNFNIAYALVRAAMARIRREETVAREYFYVSLRETTEKVLGAYEHACDSARERLKREAE